MARLDVAESSAPPSQAGLRNAIVRATQVMAAGTNTREGGCFSRLLEGLPAEGAVHAATAMANLYEYDAVFVCCGYLAPISDFEWAADGNH